MDDKNTPLHKLRNFGVVTPGFYRGGQPTAEDIRNLAAEGVKTVVCLRWGAKGIAAERAAVEATGMEFISIPLNYWTLPDNNVLNTFFSIVEDVEKQPVFLHCLHGADRTGMLVAIYRIKKMGWSFTEAYKEMKAYGFHRFRLRHFQWVVFHYSRKLKAL